MDKLLLIVKLRIPLAGFLGLVMGLRFYANAPMHLSYPIAAGILMFVLNIAGYTNFLPEVTALMYILGIVLLAACFVKAVKEKKFFTELFTPLTLFFVIMCAGFLLLYRDYRFMHPDEFSHWGTVIKDIVSLNGFPDARAMGTGREYTLSSSLFCYYFLHNTGFSQAIAYMAQGFLAAASLSVFWKNTGWKNLLGTVKSAAASLAILAVFPVSIQYLLVDYLCALFGAAITVAAVEWGKEAKNLKGFMLAMIPAVTGISFIKINAFFYRAVFVLTAVILSKKSGDVYGKKDKIKIALAALAPVFALILWNKNIDKVYLDSGAYSRSKFSFNVKAMLDTAAQKPADMKTGIITDVLFSPFSQKIAFLAAAVLVIAFVFYIYTGKKGEKNFVFKTCLIIAAVSWGVYLLFYGLSLMFMFPAWELEAFNTNIIAYERYMSVATGYSVSLVLYGLLSIETDSPKRTKALYSGVFALCIGVIAVMGYGKDILKRDDLSRRQMEQLDTIDGLAAQMSGAYTRDDSIICYIGSNKDKESMYSDYYLSLALENKNLVNLSDTSLGGGTVTGGKLEYYFTVSDYFALFAPGEELDNMLKSCGAYMDRPGGLIYKIIILDEGGFLLEKVI